MSHIEKQIHEAVEYVNQKTNPEYILEPVEIHYNAFNVRTIYAPVHKRVVMNISINFSFDYNPYEEDYALRLLDLTNHCINNIQELLMKDKEEES